MAPRRSPTSLSRVEARLRTGGAAHLLGGALDLLQALVRYRLHRIRTERTERTRRVARAGR